MIDFVAALKILIDAEVRFVVVGGVAATLHGLNYITTDLDICYARDQENLMRVCRTLSPFHPRLRGAPADLPFRFDEETLRRGMNFTLTTDLGDIDLLGEIAGVGDYAVASALSKPMEIVGRSFIILTLDALIASKKAAGRIKDLQALPELEAIREITKE